MHSLDGLKYCVQFENSYTINAQFVFLFHSKLFLFSVLLLGIYTVMRISIDDLDMLKGKVMKVCLFSPLL